MGPLSSSTHNFSALDNCIFTCFRDDHRQSGSSMFGICCCCLELPSLKSLWSQYMWMGQNEVYGEMLKDCFNLIVSLMKLKETFINIIYLFYSQKNDYKIVADVFKQSGQWGTSFLLEHNQY